MLIIMSRINQQIQVEIIKQIFQSISLTQNIFNHKQIPMLQKVKQTVPKLDRYPSVPNLSWGGKKQKQTFTGGVIGIIFILIIIILIISKSLGLISKSQVILNSFVKRDIGEVNFTGSQVMFVMMYYDNGTIDFLSYSDYQYAGLDVYIASILLNYHDKENPEVQTDLYRVAPCVGDYMLCNPFLIYNPQCSYDSLDFQVCDYVQQFHIIVTNRTEKQPILTGLYPMLFVFDTKFDLYKKDPNQILQRLPTTINKLPNAFGMDSKHRYLYEIPVTKLELTVDQSIMPNSVPIFGTPNYTETHFYPNDKLRLGSDNKTFFLDILPTYFDFYIFRSGFTQSYKRSNYRIDMMLGQVFGLVGLLTLFFGLFCSGYNKWLMQKHIESCLRDEPIEQKNQSYFTYIKQTVTCKQKKPRSVQPVYYSQQSNYNNFNSPQIYQQPINDSTNEQEKQKQIDIIHMYKKIQNMEKQIRYLKGQAQGQRNVPAQVSIKRDN